MRSIFLLAATILLSSCGPEGSLGNECFNFPYLDSTTSDGQTFESTCNGSFNNEDSCDQSFTYSYDEATNKLTQVITANHADAESRSCLGATSPSTRTCTVNELEGSTIGLTACE